MHDRLVHADEEDNSGSGLNTEKKSFSCSKCDKVFNKQRGLKIHEKMHRRSSAVKSIKIKRE